MTTRDLHRLSALTAKGVSNLSPPEYRRWIALAVKRCGEIEREYDRMLGGELNEQLRKPQRTRRRAHTSGQAVPVDSDLCIA